MTAARSCKQPTSSEAEHGREELSLRDGGGPSEQRACEAGSGTRSGDMERLRCGWGSGCSKGAEANREPAKPGSVCLGV